MEESRDPKSAVNLSDTPSTAETTGGAHAPDKEATSSETLRDIEKSEAATTSTSDDATSGAASSRSETSTPSPDGQFDDASGGGRADGSDTGGPM